MRIIVLCGAVLLAACAKKQQTAQLSRYAVTPDAPESVAPHDDALSVSGLLGTLTQEQIRGALEPKLPGFLRCATARRAELDVLAGTLTMRFNVALDGKVTNVQPVASTLGDRDTERCMLDIAKATRFPPPKGGEAELTWPLDLPLDDVREPTDVMPDPGRAPLASGRADLHAKCGGGAVQVTAYLDPTGQVLAAGVSAPELATPVELDCVAAAVRGLKFPSPGSYTGKLSFSLP